MGESISNAATQQPLEGDFRGKIASRKHFSFTAPTSYFLPSLTSTNPATFDPTTSDFGLISRSYDSDDELSRRHEREEHFTNWQRFAHHLSKLNADALANTSYHVLFLARHGQGYHNLAESYYGPQAWDCYWAELEGDPNSTISWADAHLSKLGQQQAREQSRFWSAQLIEQKMPVPSRWYASPMDRACRTLELTFKPLAEAGKVHAWKPTVKELLRETNGIHTCDRRSPKAVIASRYPEYTIESGFTETDELWDPIYRETDEAHTYRAELLLDDILGQISEEGAGSYISVTAHGGMINAILRAIGHRQFQVKVGSAIAVMLKADKHDGERQHHEFAKGDKKPACVDDPLKAGLPGYDSLKDYIDKVEASVESIK